MIVYLVRHARAGKRGEWEGDDRLRPLDERGVRQAQGLVEQLSGRELRRILSSPYVRCVQSVEPLAEARGLPSSARRRLRRAQARKRRWISFAGPGTP